MGSNSELVRSLESMLGISLGPSVSDTLVVAAAATSLAVILGLFVLVWRRSSDRSKEVKPVVVSKSLTSKDEDEDEDVVAEGKTRLTIFFGTQTGTAEGFAKVILLC